MFMLLFYMRRRATAFTGTVLFNTLWQLNTLAIVVVTAIAGAALLLAIAFVFFKRAKRTSQQWEHRETEFHALNKALKDKNDKISALVEELMSANEELTAANEELSSTNEELVTTNDKLQEAYSQIQQQSELILAQKDEQLNKALDASNVMIWSIDLTGNDQHYMSRNIGHTFDISAEELHNGRPQLDRFVVEEDRPVREAAIQQLIKSGHAEAVYRMTGKDGNIRWINVHLRILHDSLGNPVRREGIGIDITEDRQRQEEIDRYRENLDIIFTNTVEEIVLMDASGRIILMNNALKSFIIEITGRTPEPGQYIWDITAPGRRDRSEELFKRAKAGENIMEEACFTTARGEIVHELRYQPVRCDGETRYVTLTSIDITEKKRNEDNRRASEERFRNLVENSDDLFLIAQGESDFSYVSPNITKMLGYTPEEFVQLYTTHVVHPEDLKLFRQRLTTLNPGQREQFFARARHKNGDWRLLEGTTVNLPNTEGINGRVQVYHDVTDRQDKENRIIEAEEAVREHRYLLEKAGEVAQVGYWTSDLSGSGRINWSTQAQKIYGIPTEKFDGRYETLLRVIHPEDRINVKLAYEQAIRENQEYSVDFRIMRPDGSLRWVHEQGELISEYGEDVTWMTITLDISRHKVIEEVLKEFNERYEILSRATNDAIWDWDIKIGIVTWNHGLQTIFGYPSRDVNFTTTWWKEKIHPEDFRQVWPQIMRAFRERQTNWDATYRYRCSDGTYKYIFDRAYIIYVDNEPVRMIGAMQDVSERMNAVAEIEKLSLVASQTDSAVMIMDAQEQIEWINEGFTKMTGYILEELKGKNAQFIRDPENDPITALRIEEKLKRCETVSEEIVAHTKDGRKYWANLEITPVLNEKGDVKNFISIQSDISERKEYENSITAIAGELASLIEHANVPIFSLDRDRLVSEWNSVTAELSGYSKTEVYGKNWVEEFVDRRHRTAVISMLDQVMGGKPVNQFELPIQNRARKIYILLLSASPRWNATGAIDGAILVGQDITELTEYRLGLEQAVRERTRELNEALVKEKEMVDMKSKFVSIASHEFRTPLTTISLASGFIRRYKKQLNTEQVDKKLDNIDKQITHMTHMLEDVLMIGKAEAGKIIVSLSEIHLGEFIEGLVEEMKENNRERIHLHLDLDPAVIQSDEKLLRNILLNLVTNALKFSDEEKSVQLKITTDIEKMVIQISDEGVGIPEADIRNLFTPFYRASNVTIIPGTGLGLSIIKKAVDLLKGTVTVKSTLGTGTLFTVVLPMNHG
jgi:PAS domain S-box-containing protein